MFDKLGGFFGKKIEKVPEVSEKKGDDSSDKDKQVNLLLSYQEQIIYALEQSVTLMNIERRKFEAMLAAFMLSQGKDTVLLEQSYIDTIYSEVLGVNVVNTDDGKTELGLYKLEADTEDTEEGDVE